MFRLLIVLWLIPFSLFSTVIETDKFSDISPFVTNETLILFDIDETLLESEISLGSSTWRQTMRKIFEANPLPDFEFPYYDLLVIFVERQVPMKPVEPGIPELIGQMKKQGAQTMSLTGRTIDTEHYRTPVHDQGEMVYRLLLKIGIDFDQEKPDWVSEAFHRGILFADHVPKGPFLTDQLASAPVLPAQVIFADDKIKDVESVDRELEKLGIPSFSFWYRYSELYSKKDFDLMTSVVQLDHLFKTGEILGEKEAKGIAQSMEEASANELILQIIQENKQFLLNYYLSVQQSS